MISTPTRTLPLTRHFGVWDARRVEVIHSALPTVQVSTLEEFANGEVRIERQPLSGLGDLVVARARAYLGTQYDLLQFNCEHLANLVNRQEDQPATAARCGGWHRALAASIEGQFELRQLGRALSRQRRQVPPKLDHH